MGEEGAKIGWLIKATELIVLTASEIALPQLITAAGLRVARRFVEFFTANIRNRNTRAAYGRNITRLPGLVRDRGRHCPST